MIFAAEIAAAFACGFACCAAAVGLGLRWASRHPEKLMGMAARAMARRSGTSSSAEPTGSGFGQRPAGRL